MITSIHPTAIIEPGAVLGDGCEVGPYSHVGAGVRLGARNRLHSHVVLSGQLDAGDDNEFFPFACIGGRTEDLKYTGTPATFVRVGDRNVFREHCTVNAATAEGGVTRIGSDCTLLSDSHVGHESVMGDAVILGCGSKLAGHVTVEDHAIINGMTGVIQFVRVGAHAFIGATNKVTKDVLPFFIAEGNPSAMRGINVVGLSRRGFDAERIGEIRRVARKLFASDQGAMATLDTLRTIHDGNPDFETIVRFAATSAVGIARLGRGRADGGDA